MTNSTPPPPANPYQAPTPMNPADEKLWATLVHVGGILFYFVPALIGYIVLKDRGPFIRAHTATALNFQLTLLIAYAVGGALTIILVGYLVLLAAFVLMVVFGIMAALAANRGEYYTYPLSIKFVN
ncbi:MULTISPECIES: DUF4870 domain-containing protein [unclassified Cryobacterium]|uniref:DUF4870 domain-containing protein n=1 Tax=unclassified Cryobacterium TaxID=2649013 RepID=UPI001F545D24|nr:MULTISPECIES: DUF4870 domain-containing protein [unclassified Cryobacterium]